MIIECPKCNKKFEIDQSLLSKDGRLLQCGSCSHKWFFKINITEKINNEKINIKTEKDLKTSFSPINKIPSKKDDTETDKTIKKEVNTKKNINFLNILLVIIISILALILILDTFKNNLETLFPNIKFLLNNLYQTIEDIKLFIFDLIK